MKRRNLIAAGILSAMVMAVPAGSVWAAPSTESQIQTETEAAGEKAAETDENTTGETREQPPCRCGRRGMRRGFNGVPDNRKRSDTQNNQQKPDETQNNQQAPDDRQNGRQMPRFNGASPQV